MINTLQLTILASLVYTASFAQLSEEPALVRKAKKIHERAFTVDTHADTPMLLTRPDFDVTKENDPKTSKVDFPRMRKGGLDGIFWAVYLGQGPRTDEGHQLLITKRNVKNYTSKCKKRCTIRFVLIPERQLKRDLYTV